MHILITGAAGFIGQILARELLNSPDHTVLLADITPPPIPQGCKHPENAKCVQVDLLFDASSVITPELDAAYLFHGIMSSGAEANFDLGMSVNIDSTRRILDAVRHTVPGLRVIYASSEAVYGMPLPQNVTEDVFPLPESSYGCQKMICETLVNDYTRRGFITGFSLRFPTISVRPGKPTAAASSFISGIVREPLKGEKCIVPLENRSWKHWMCSPKTLVFNLLVALKLPKEALPPHKRAINVPGFAVTIQDMMDALAEVGGKDKLEFVVEKEDPFLKPILESWGDSYDNSLGVGLGMNQDSSFVQSVRDYVEGLGEEKKT